MLIMLYIYLNFTHAHTMQLLINQLLFTWILCEVRNDQGLACVFTHAHCIIDPIYQLSSLVQIWCQRPSWTRRASWSCPGSWGSKVLFCALAEWSTFLRDRIWFLALTRAATLPFSDLGHRKAPSDCRNRARACLSLQRGTSKCGGASGSMASSAK